MPYKDPTKAREHARLRVRKYRSKPEIKEKEREKSKERYLRNPEKARDYFKDYIFRFRERYVARYKLMNAIQSGKILKPDICECCKIKGNLHGHHKDYLKPLDVEWLCPKCHMKKDKGLSFKYDEMAKKYIERYCI